MSLTLEQLHERLTGIGGSDAGAVLGLDKYRTPLSIYLEKIGQLHENEESAAMYWGKVLEDVVAGEYARRTGTKVRRVNKTLRHHKHDFMVAHVDREVLGKDKILECKTAGQYMTKEWGPAGTDEVPDTYLVQCTHYMIVKGTKTCDLAVLIGGRDFRIYTLTLDPELAGMIVDKEGAFWSDHVEKRVPPDPQTLTDLETLYAIDNGEALVATDLQEEEVFLLSQIRIRIKDLEDTKDNMSFQIKRALKNYSVLLDGAGKKLVSWKLPSESEYFDVKAFAKDHPKLHKDYLRSRVNTRRFLVK